eukprot:CAMPEP_0117438964 /NCGR_PEP_ID=MMETSP0759-20121206/2326_1 /TAXON_ID=63605 /ORGANISM="Percolomonas cosmopolitus, Strain WS" /LENGTH=215 /DNA_ID=CAMNT_0005230675 /DNA_START=2397 /DNA_END=3044 /DNA_ORIENTATION=+
MQIQTSHVVSDKILLTNKPDNLTCIRMYNYMEKQNSSAENFLRSLFIMCKQKGIKIDIPEREKYDKAQLMEFAMRKKKTTAIIDQKILDVPDIDEVTLEVIKRKECETGGDGATAEEKLMKQRFYLCQKFNLKTINAAFVEQFGGVGQQMPFIDLVIFINRQYNLYDVSIADNMDSFHMQRDEWIQKLMTAMGWKLEDFFTGRQLTQKDYDTAID